MSLNDAVKNAAFKKVTLLEKNFARYAVRSILAGVYLTLATGFAAVMAQKVENIVPGLGSLVFTMLFFVGLAAIVLLNAELATGNMMFMVFGVSQKYVKVKQAAWLLLVCTFFNLVGAALVGILLSQAASFANITPDSFISTLTQAKLTKPSLGLLVEAIGANFVVNMAIVGTIFIKEFVGKFFMLMFVIGMFVGLGLEHVIANFSLVNIVGFTSSPLPADFSATSILRNWSLVWIGNFIGGGLLMGGIYAWLNRGVEEYRD